MPTIVCVDENVRHAYHLAQTMQRAGHLVITAHSLAAAVSIVPSLPRVDAVVAHGRHFRTRHNLRPLLTALPPDVRVFCMCLGAEAPHANPSTDVMVLESAEAITSALARLFPPKAAAASLPVAQERT